MPRHPSPIVVLPDRWNKKTARRLLAEWKASGESLAQFARDRGLKSDRLRWWKKQFADEERTRSRHVRATPARRLTFVPAITTARAPSAAAEHVIVRLPGGIEVEATSVDLLPPAWLATVARTVVSGA